MSLTKQIKLNIPIFEFSPYIIWEMIPKWYFLRASLASPHWNCSQPYLDCNTVTKKWGILWYSRHPKWILRYLLQPFHYYTSELATTIEKRYLSHDRPNTKSNKTSTSNPQRNFLRGGAHGTHKRNLTLHFNKTPPTWFHLLQNVSIDIVVN